MNERKTVIMHRSPNQADHARRTRKKTHTPIHVNAPRNIRKKNAHPQNMQEEERKKKKE